MGRPGSNVITTVPEVSWVAGLASLGLEVRPGCGPAGSALREAISSPRTHLPTAPGYTSRAGGWFFTCSLYWSHRSSELNGPNRLSSRPRTKYHRPGG